MQEIPLIAVANQQLQIDIDNHHWELIIKVARDMMVCDIWLNDNRIILASRAVANAPLIPYTALATVGNFAFVTERDQLPWYEAFGQTQSLLFWGPDD